MVDLATELNALRKNLVVQFNAGQWESLSETLYCVSKLSEGQGQRELCLRAQSLRELMGMRGAGRATAGERLRELFDELMVHISHLQWRSQTNH